MGVINRGLPTLPLIFGGPHFGSQRMVFPGVTEVTPVSVVSGGPGLLDAFVRGRLRLGPCFHTGARLPACWGQSRYSGAAAVGVFAVEDADLLVAEEAGATADFRKLDRGMGISSSR